MIFGNFTKQWLQYEIQPSLNIKGTAAIPSEQNWGLFLFTPTRQFMQNDNTIFEM